MRMTLTVTAEWHSEEQKRVKKSANKNNIASKAMLDGTATHSTTT